MILRMAWLLLLSSLFFIVVQSFSVILGMHVLPLLVAPMVIVYGAYYLSVGQCGFLAICVGVVIDGLSGYTMGLSSLVLLLFMLITAVIVSFLGKPSYWLVFLTAIGVSVGYRCFWALLILLFSQGKANFSFLDLLWAPIADGICAVGYVWLTERFLVLLKVTDSGEIGVAQNGSI